MAAVPHYFDAEPDAQSHPRTVSLRLLDVDMRLHSDAGVFAAGRVDSGTRFLLQQAPAPPPRGELLDLGCGYGPIALTLASRSPGARVWAVDVNQRAIALAARNVAEAGLDNVRVVSEDELPADIRFQAIYSNPPVRIGLQLLHPLLLHWIGRLSPTGMAYLVVHRHLGSDSLGRWLASQGFGCERLASHAGYRILRVQPRAAVEDDR